MHNRTLEAINAPVNSQYKNCFERESGINLLQLAAEMTKTVFGLYLDYNKGLYRVVRKSWAGCIQAYCITKNKQKAYFLSFIVIEVNDHEH